MLFRQAKLCRPSTTARGRVLRRAGRRPINSVMALLLLVVVLAVGALMVGDGVLTNCAYNCLVRITHLCTYNGRGRRQWLCVQTSVSMGFTRCI